MANEEEEEEENLHNATGHLVSVPLAMTYIRAASEQAHNNNCGLCQKVLSTPGIYSLASLFVSVRHKNLPNSAR
jgi:hypothetical protein